MLYSDTCNKQFRSQQVNQCAGRFYYELPSNVNYLYHPGYFSTLPYNTCQYAHVLSLYIRNYPLTLPKPVPQGFRRKAFHNSLVIAYTIIIGEIISLSFSNVKLD